ncbi:MAG: prephenate dehydrogenase/arogenate dehydrogenase family protein [Rickettsiales bacterium]|jgi:prephenate dehydrogenase|nr:prephenate dehydrogenase/arogenate dehydrogenase family protein [Rickettsiales bacterium]
MSKICIIGIGLIGSSLARAIKKKKICDSLLLIDNNKENTDFMKDNGYDTSNTIDSNIKDVDLFIIATPLSAIVSVVKQILVFAHDKAIITDVGSVKYPLVREVEKNLKNKNVFFVGGHPIAGTEKSGAKSGFDTLFDNKKCILTPSRKTDKFSLEKVKTLWKNIGMNVELLSPKKHDEIFSIMSHIPHLIAFHYYKLAKDKKILNYAGTGFSDFTRIAHSPMKIWNDIFYYNEEYIKKYLKKFIDSFKNLD